VSARRRSVDRGGEPDSERPSIIQKFQNILFALVWGLRFYWDAYSRAGRDNFQKNFKSIGGESLLAPDGPAKVI